MRKLLEYTLSTHISSVNLITSICVLSNVAKQRPEYMAIVLNTYSKLLQNMPPTLGNSQVSTVRKQIKLQIISICKNPYCAEYVKDITKILTDLGASSNEISKILPKANINESRKRQLSSFSLDKNDLKKPKVNVSSSTSKTFNEASSAIQYNNTKPLDLTNLEKVIDDLVSKLNVKENVTDLVMVSMAYLPDQMPITFVNSFKPISAAGTSFQIRSLARMLALQLNEAKLISLDSSIKNTVTIDEDIYDEDNDENEDIEKPHGEKKDTFELNEINELSNSKKSKLPQTSKTLPIKPLNSILPSKKVSNKAYKLNEVTLIAANQFNTNSLEELLFKTYSRILSSEGFNHFILFIIIIFLASLNFV
jgi:symplekin